MCGIIIFVRIEALAAIRAWTRLDQAIAGFNRALERDHGVTGAQLAILRIVREFTERADGVALAALRERLVMHPATLGQLLDRLAERGLVTVTADPRDRRRRMVALSADGRRLTDAAPLAGPVRLRHVDADPERLARLAAALEDAIVLFGLDKEHEHDGPSDPAQHRSETGGRPASGGDRRRRGPASGGG